MTQLDAEAWPKDKAKLSGWKWMRWRIAVAVWRAASVADPIATRWSGVTVAAAIIGVVPVLFSFVGGNTFHQPLAALLLAPLVWSCARRDDWQRGMMVLAMTFAWHSATMIALARSFPALAVEVVPDGVQYWDKQWAWITTGLDPEYDLTTWIFAHLQLLAGTTLFSFTSLGAITLHQGLYEVDLMNFYNARLIENSQSGWWSMALGWHIWSILRGCGYVVVTFEMVSLSLQIFTGEQTSTWQNRGRRWAIGFAFLAADALTKIMFLEAVRVRLHDNLL